MFNIQQVPSVKTGGRSCAGRPIKGQGIPNRRGVPTGSTIEQQYENRFNHLSLGCLLENKPVVNKYDTVEALVSGHPRDVIKMSVTGAGCLRE